MLVRDIGLTQLEPHPRTDPPKWNVGTIYNTSAEVKEKIDSCWPFDDGTSRFSGPHTLTPYLFLYLPAYPRSELCVDFAYFGS
jgi:hypothetical protein